MNYPYSYAWDTWPIGTVRAEEMPAGYQSELAKYVGPDGALPADWIVHRTATEGPYISFSGYKVRVIIVHLSEDTYIVKLV